METLRPEKCRRIHPAALSWGPHSKEQATTQGMPSHIMDVTTAVTVISQRVQAACGQISWHRARHQVRLPYLFGRFLIFWELIQSAAHWLASR
jgi:hypothetical protein